MDEIFSPGKKEKKEHHFPGIGYNAPVTLTFALLAIAVLVIGMITKDASTKLLFCVYRSRFSFAFVIRLFGHTLGHSGWSHLFNNMSLFLLLGPGIEERYGSRNFLEMILITALVSGLVFIAFSSNSALLGASGLVFMMIIVTSSSCWKDGKIPLTMILVILIYLGEEIYTGVTATDNISQLTHIVGGVCGVLFGLFYKGGKAKD